MIYKRVAARLQAQDWAAITIELSIVVVGVFIGTQVSNWNAARLERAETTRMLSQLQPQIAELRDFLSSTHGYYATTRRYAGTALAGWKNDPTVSDNDFVIAAYQASQIAGLGTNGSTLASIFGADRLRSIDDPAIRRDLSWLVSSDTSSIDQAAVDTPYRQNVRRIIPVEIQDAIRSRCGDATEPGRPKVFLLPNDCPLVIPASAAKAAAISLRAHPELANDLRGHVAAVAVFLINIKTFEETSRNLEHEIRPYHR